MSFYEDMRAMACDVLAPEAARGLGQGRITVVRTEQEPIPADWPSWEIWTGSVTTKTYRIYGAASGVAKELVDGTTILASDMMLICADRMTLIETKAGDDPAVASTEEVAFSLGVPETVSIDGRPHTTLQRVAVPGAGIAVAHKYILRA